MAVMSMNKVIHGAVRRDLRRFDQQLTDHHEGEHEIAFQANLEAPIGGLFGRGYRKTVAPVWHG